MTERNRWVDYAKAIGITLVVYGHISRGIHSAGLPIEEGFYKTTFSILYTFHMPLFFFLSGLFFKDSLVKRGKIGLVKIKFDTIIYPYIIWSILQGSVEAALASHTNGGLTFTEVFRFAWEPRAQFWFLYALFSIFVLCSLTFQLKGKLFPYIYITIFALLFVFKENAPRNFILEFIYSNCIFFVLGIYFYVIKDFFHKYSALLSFVFGVAFFIYQYIFHSIMGETYKSGGAAALFLALTSIAFIVTFSMVISKKSIKLLSFMGESSMPIYLMHILAGSGARIILVKIFGIESVMVHLVVGTVVGIFAPLLAVIIINKFNLKFFLTPPKALSISNRSSSAAAL